MTNKLKSLENALEEPLKNSYPQFKRHIRSCMILIISGALVLALPVLLYCAITKQTPAPNWVALPSIAGSLILLCAALIQGLRAFLDFNTVYRIAFVGLAIISIGVNAWLVSIGIAPNPLNEIRPKDASQTKEAILRQTKNPGGD